MVTKLTCPQCSKELEFDEDMEYGFCTRCGMKIQAPEKLDIRGYLSKGYAALGAYDFEEAYENLANAIELMDEAKFMEKRQEMVMKIVDAISSITQGTEVNSGDSVNLLFAANAKDSDEEACFAVTILELIEKRVKTIDPANLPWVYIEYCEIVLSCIATAFDPKLMLYAAYCARSFLSEKGFNGLYKTFMIEGNVELVEAASCFYDRLIKRLEEKLDAISDEELDRVIDFWIENGNPSFLSHIYNASTLSFNRMNKGRLGKRKFMKEITAEVDAFVDCYFDCVVE